MLRSPETARSPRLYWRKSSGNGVLLRRITVADSGPKTPFHRHRGVNHQAPFSKLSKNLGQRPAFLGMLDIPAAHRGRLSRHDDNPRFVRKEEFDTTMGSMGHPAIGLSKARRAGIELPPPAAGKVGEFDRQKSCYCCDGPAPRTSAAEAPSG